MPVSGNFGSLCRRARFTGRRWGSDSKSSIWRVIEYVYDDLNRNTQELWKDGQTIVRTITFAYDAAGQLTEASDPDGTIDYTYDNLGRTTKTIQTVEGLTPNVELRYTYDAAGNCTYLTAYLGGTFNTGNVYYTTYDNLNRLRRVFQSGTAGAVSMKLAYFTFDALDRLTVINRFEYNAQTGWQSAVLDGYSFDADSRLTQLIHYGTHASPLVTYTWTYDRASRPTGFTTQYADQNFDDDTGDYTYDDTGQLTTADYDYQTDETYTYDANGNRTNSGYDTDANNRLASDGVYDYEYDDEGNRTRRTRISDESVTEYTWDYRNRLTKVTELDELGGNVTKEVEYKYDPDDRLVGKTLDPDGAGEEEASEEYYAYDQTPFSTRESASQMLFRFTGPTVDDLADRYLWAPVIDLLLSDEKLTGPSTPGDIYWALGDNLNTVRDIARYNPSTDTTTIVNHRVYDAFGKLTSESNAAVDLIFSYTGRLFDEATGLQNNLNRWYDPTPGRWLSEDPIGFTAGDANLQRYVNNAPTVATDPSGLQVSGGGSKPSATPVRPIMNLLVSVGIEWRRGQTFVHPDEPWLYTVYGAVFVTGTGMTNPAPISTGTTSSLRFYRERSIWVERWYRVSQLTLTTGGLRTVAGPWYSIWERYRQWQWGRFTLPGGGFLMTAGPAVSLTPGTFAEAGVTLQMLGNLEDIKYASTTARQFNNYGPLQDNVPADWTWWSPLAKYAPWLP